MSPTQVEDPTGAEAMAEGDSSSMETPSSEGKVPGLPEVPGSPEGRGGLEVVSAAGGGHYIKDKYTRRWTVEDLT